MILRGFRISCRKLHSCHLFNLLTCIQVIPFWISISYIFSIYFSNARPRHSVFSSLSSIIILSIWYRSFLLISDSIFSYAYSSELTLFFPSGGFHPQIFNNSIVLFMPVNFIYVFGIMPAVLSRPNFSILRTKVSQDPAFVWWIPRAMYETCGFWLTLRVVYISSKVYTQTNLSHTWNWAIIIWM